MVVAERTVQKLKNMGSWAINTGRSDSDLGVAAEVLMRVLLNIAPEKFFGKDQFREWEQDYTRDYEGWAKILFLLIRLWWSLESFVSNLKLLENIKYLIRII